MLRSKAGALSSLVVATDHLVSGATCLAVMAMPRMAQWQPGQAPFEMLVVALAATTLWPLLFEHMGLYRSQRKVPLHQLAAQLLLAAVVSSSAIAALSYLIGAPVAPRFAILCAAAQLVTLGSFRLGLWGVLHVARRQGRNFRTLLVIGSGPRARQALVAIQEHPEWGLRILGFVDECDTPVDAYLADQPIHKMSDLPDLFRDEVVDEVVVACPRGMLTMVEPAIAACAAVGVPVTLFSDLFGDYLPPPRSSRFGDVPALSFAVVHHSPVKLAVKRTIDIAGASALLLLAAPVIAVAALAVKLTSPGPVFFRQVRCGLYGRRFEMLKLRSMYVDAEERKRELMHLNEASGPVFKIRDDPRITSAGRVLRRWSIDELPQLWNVVRGDMSLVGPRPPIPAEVAQYEFSDRRRLSMRPGLTCLWQVKGRSRIGFQDWLKLDLQYIDGWSLAMDAKILVQTLPAVLRGTGAS